MFTIFRDLAKFLVQVNFTKHHWHPVLKLTVTIVQEKLDVVGRNWNRLEQFWRFDPNFSGANCTALAGGVKLQDALLKAVASLARLARWDGSVRVSDGSVGTIVGRGIDLQVVRMMERHYKNGFVGPRFMTLEVGGKCRFFFGGWKLRWFGLVVWSWGQGFVFWLKIDCGWLIFD